MDLTTRLALLTLLSIGATLKAQQTPPTDPPVPAPGDALYAPIATADNPASLHQKFVEFVILTSGPRALIFPLIPSAIRMVNPRDGYPREWRLGAGAFGRHYGDSLATQSAKETSRFLASALLREDFRYRPSTSKNPFVRGLHAISFTFVDKSDSGQNRLAISNFVGAGASGFVGNLYLPRGFNNLSHAETRSAIAFAGFASQNLLREFAPDLSRITRKLRLPFPRVPFPEWWMKLDH